MKFSDGNWMVKEGYKVFSPAHAYDVKVFEQEVQIIAPSHYITHRAMTLGGPVFHLRISSPLEGILRVQIIHFSGEVDSAPHFTLQEESANVTIIEKEDYVELCSGTARVVVQKAGTFKMDFYDDDRFLTRSSYRGAAWIQEESGKNYVREQLQLSVSEMIYGLGERFTPLIKNGQSIDIWNEDGGTSSEQSYKNIPFYLSTKGYGVFVNHPEKVSFEIGSEKVSKVQFSVAGEALDYMVISGKDPKEVIQQYTRLTGRPTLPPAWSFGLWLSTSFTTDYDEKTVQHFIDGMVERNIPFHVFHFDCFWMKEYEWCNFTWDERIFPDPEGLLKRLHDKNLRVCVWINPYISQFSTLFEEGKQHGYLLRRKNGAVWQWDMWQPGMGLVDFTNPQARAWFQGYLRKLLIMGVDTFKTDFGERIPVDVVYFDGSDSLKMHNYYTYLYNQTVFEVIQEVKGQSEAVVFARSATVGSQKFPVHWGGDCDATYESMAESLRGGLSLSLCGFGFWSHDIAGFENTATPDLYKRWVAFGLLSTHSRLHGSGSYRVPWLFDDEAVDVLRAFVSLKYKLMPYLYARAVEASQEGIPVMRSMFLEFPHDTVCHHLDRQYMLGNAILVAPIFNEKSQGDFYLPKGTWTHLQTGEQLEGGQYYAKQFDYFSLPIYVRENTILALGDHHEQPDYDYEQQVTYHVFSMQDGNLAQTVVVTREGEVAQVATMQRVGDHYQFHVDGTRGTWQLRVHGHHALHVVQGHQQHDSEGEYFVARQGENVIILQERG